MFLLLIFLPLPTIDAPRDIINNIIQVPIIIIIKFKSNSLLMYQLNTNYLIYLARNFNPPMDPPVLQLPYACAEQTPY